jgi:hypothetical protein
MANQPEICESCDTKAAKVLFRPTRFHKDDLLASCDTCLNLVCEECIGEQNEGQIVCIDCLSQQCLVEQSSHL